MNLWTDIRCPLLTTGPAPCAAACARVGGGQVQLCGGRAAEDHRGAWRCATESRASGSWLARLKWQWVEPGQRSFDRKTYNPREFITFVIEGASDDY
ncbi:MAG: hypothetical protein NTX42_07500 [Methanothrix sp.]|nr:hypothetical protein [Methanothrix sp.]